MSWSGAFSVALATERRAPRFVLEVVTMWHEPGATWSIGTHPGLGSETRIGLRGVDIQGCTLSPRGWSSTVGSWSVTLVGEFQVALSHLTRGTIVVLKAGFDGMALADFNQVAIGQVRNLRGRPPAWTLEILDLYSACRQRLEVNRSLSGLFSNVGSVTTVATAYTPGDGSLKVASTTGFDRETGTDGAVLCTPSGGGDPFYLAYSGTNTGPVRFTGVSSSAICGTTASALAIGDTVQDVAYLTGHPLDIVRKILASRGTGNGIYDTYPMSWGLGVLDAAIDHTDVNAYKAAVVAVAGTYKWEFVVTAPVEDGYGFLSGLMAPAGLFLAVREGQLTVRAAQNTQTATYLNGVLDDADIADVEDYESFDSTHTPEYCYVDVQSTGAIIPGTVSDAATLPMAPTLTYDLSDRVFGNDAQICTEVLDRVAESATRIPERLVVRCCNLRPARLTPGDVINLTTRRAHSRRDGAAGFVDRRALVQEVSPHWMEGTVTVGLLVYPETDDVFA